LSVILSCMRRIIAESNQPISLKLDVVIGSDSWKNRLTFSGDRVPDTDFPDYFSTSLTIAE